MLCLAIFAYGATWRLLDEDCAELGSFPSQTLALAAAGDHARRVGAPRHALVRSEDGWREILVGAAAAEADGPEADGAGLRAPRFDAAA